jgi:hypothetical protein
MTSQKVVTVSWFDRIKQSVGGVAIGLVLIFGMVGALFWNEGRAVQTEKSLAEGAGMVVSVPTDTVELGNEGKLVHVTGYVTTSAPVLDSEFGISANGLSLARKVEMYQWVQSSKTEKKTELGGSETQVTTYNYAQEWSESAQNSSEFHEAEGHQNPTMEVQSDKFNVASANLGGFQLDDRIISQIGVLQNYAVGDAALDAVQAAVGAGIRAHMANNGIYLGRNPQQPELGDYRISYQFAPASEVSIVAQQAGIGFAPYQTQSGDSLLLTDAGKVEAAAMFKDAAEGNNTMTWIIRIVGMALLIAGFGAVLGPISVIASVVPFLGSIMGFGTGVIATILGVALGSLTIGVAWLFYRPLTAIIIFAVAAAIIVGLVYLGKKKAAAKAPSAAQPA